MNEIAISIKNVSKCYKIYAHPVDRLKEIILPGKSRAKEFWALQNISLDIYKGETLGIVGRNGSGKSTLLQIIAGTLTPTEGEVQISGRIAALLELGSGFNPEFTGRENVFFNGRILGLSREEIETRYDSIAAFAEIGDFINQPVKTYSSGMVVRLAFAVLANTEPKILIVDEALAVGDAKFQARCMKRIRQLKEQGVTILFVSHDSSSVNMLCQRAALMNQGRLLEIGEPKEIINHYIALLSSEIEETETFRDKGDTNIDDIQIEATTNNNHIHEVNNLTSMRISDVPTIPSSEGNHHTVNGKNENLINQNFVEAKNSFITNQSQSHYRHGNKLAAIRQVKMTNSYNREVTEIITGEDVKLEILLKANSDLSDLVIGISIRNLIGLVVYGVNTRLMNVKIPNLAQHEDLNVIFQFPCYLNKGIYTVTAAVHSEDGISYDWIDDILVFEVNNGNPCEGVVDLNVNVQVKNFDFNLI